jgi:hypothetical protein
MDSGAVQVAYYGGFGMPTVVLLGGDNHDVLFTTQNFTTSDTTTMRDLILNTFTAGVQDIQEIKNLKAYPNPASETVNISFEAVQGADLLMRITDLSGRTVMAFENEKLNKGLIQKQIDVSSLPVGSYVLNMELNGKVITEKINVTR